MTDIRQKLGDVGDVDAESDPELLGGVDAPMVIEPGGVGDSIIS
jgi:hypothetical protein